MSSPSVIAGYTPVGSAVDAYCRVVNAANAPRRAACNILTFAALAGSLWAPILSPGIESELLGLLLLLLALVSFVVFKPARRKWSRSNLRLVIEDDLIGYLMRSRSVPAFAKDKIAQRFLAGAPIGVTFLTSLDHEFTRERDLGTHAVTTRVQVFIAPNITMTTTTQLLNRAVPARRLELEEATQ